MSARREAREVKRVAEHLIPLGDNLSQALAVAFLNNEEDIIDPLLHAHLALWRLRWEFGLIAPADEERQENRGYVPDGPWNWVPARDQEPQSSPEVSDDDEDEPLDPSDPQKMNLPTGPALDYLPRVND